MSLITEISTIKKIEEIPITARVSKVCPFKVSISDIETNNEISMPMKKINSRLFKLKHTSIVIDSKKH